MIYTFRGKTYELDNTDISYMETSIEEYEEYLRERNIDVAEQTYENGVDEVVEKTIEQCEGELTELPWIIVEKAKKDFRTAIEAELDAAIHEELDNYREEVLETNFKDRMIDKIATELIQDPALMDLMQTAVGISKQREGETFQEVISFLNGRKEHA